ncbi:MAG: hypothetical protein WDO74_16160 [Pseudomonadota bacterium]
MSGRVFALLAFSSLAACNTYNDSLLVGSLGSSVPVGGDTGSGGSGSAAAGESNGAAASGDRGGDAGADGETGLGGGSGHAGEPTAEAGSSGSVGNAGSVGSGGTSGAPGSAGSAGMSAAGSGPGPIGEQIDDFEDQDEFILRLSMRNGPWYVVYDATTTGTISPLSSAIVPLTGADVRPGSSSTGALHLTASGFKDWGAGVGADMVNVSAKKAPYDVSAYRGIRFYAKIASGTTATVKVLLPNIYSDADGGKCDDTVSTKRCGDHLFKSVSGLKTTWDVYEVKFSDFTQQPFGLPQPAFDPTGVYSVQFTLANKLAIDLWLDDVSFIPK